MKTMAVTERILASPALGRSALRAVRDTTIAVAYFLLAHVYDGLCYVVSNLYSYGKALVLMSIVLFPVSALLVALHSAAAHRWGWDILGLAALSAIQNERGIPPRRFFKRFVQWTLNQGRWWIFGIGSIFIGPPVITPILAKKNKPLSALSYLAGGSLLSVVFWVTVWSGVGLFTWRQYILPLFRSLAGQ